MSAKARASGVIVIYILSAVAFIHDYARAPDPWGETEFSNLKFSIKTGVLPLQGAI